MASVTYQKSVKLKKNSEPGTSTEIQPNGEIKQNWSHDMLTKLQESAVPVPIRVACTNTPQGKPEYLGEEYHGRLSKGDDRKILQGKSGRFIIRDTHGTTRVNEYTLVFNYGGDIQTIKLVYTPSTKTFKTDPTSNKQYKTVLLLMNEVLSLYHNLEKRQAGSARSSPSKKSSYQKAHNFHLHTYLHPKWCDHCKEFLWGLHNQGYRCDDCNLSVHKLCKDIMDFPCSKLEYGTKISVGECNKYEPEEADFNTPKAKRASLPDFHNKCKYFRDCSQFLSAYNIRDVYIDMTTNSSTKCFCATCIDEHTLDSDNKITSVCFPNWTSHQFKEQDDPLKRNVTNWEIAYFPIKPKYLLKMITECFEPPNADDEIDLLIAKNFEHTIQDMTNENYSHKYVNSQSGDYSYAQLVLEIYVKPTCYEKVSLANNVSQCFEKCDNVSNHFRVKKSKFIYPKSILMKIFGEEVANDGGEC